jgi:NAD(P)-dependent dehydrogenase (short-subunit alcohol dehydrogenase family)
MTARTRGRGVFVTGASSGIGEAVARRLSADGVEVFAAVRTADDVARARALATAGPVHPLLVDVTDPATVRDAVGKIDAATGGVGLAGVVSNAGIVRGGPVEFVPLDHWREQFEVNVFGQVSVVRETLGALRAGRGRLVLMGSISGRISTPMLAPYCATKFVVEALAEALRHELRPWRLPVIVVSPGAVRTPIWGKGRALIERLERELPADAFATYGDAIAGTRRAIDAQEAAAIPADKVARVVARALSTPRPRAHYPVGVDSRLGGGIIARFAPDRLRDLAVRKLIGP